MTSLRSKLNAPLARRAARVAGVVGILLAVVLVRVLVGAHGELRQGDALRAAGDVDAALVHYRRAAKWYAPGNPWSAAALDALRELAREAEDARRLQRALAAWRAVRGAILSTRSTYTPHADRLAEADERIAALMAAEPPPPIDAHKSEEERRAEHLALLRDVPRPHPGWALLALLGFAAWVGAAFLFAARAIDAEDRFVPTAARRFGALFAVGVAAFVVGLGLA
ncbi:MAG: hypothetical protein KF901_15060 [Myxococcales bacterium]|nr:hypothetical protein [Myxococcales bacterium]